MSDGPATADAPRALAWLQGWLLDRVTTPDTALSSARGRGHSEGDEEVVLGGRLLAFERVDIYRQAYFARLSECLVDDYPAVAHALGTSAFQASCLDFILNHPPQSASLNFYGAPFARHLAERGTGPRAFLGDLARLEWAVVEAIHSDAGTALHAEVLGALSDDEWARSRLVPSPALRLISSAYPVDGYYQAFLDGCVPPLPDPACSVVAVCRRGDHIRRKTLSAPMAELLGRLIGGQPILSALAALADGQLSSDPDEMTASLQSAFRDWVACGFFSAIEVEGPP